MTQGYLLEFLKDNLVVPLGSTKPQSTDVRIIAASRLTISEKVLNGSFSLELFDRLSGLKVQTPALRNRGSDILPLAKHFLAEQAEFRGEAVKAVSTSAAALLQSHSWPGNVRELATVIKHAASTPGSTVQVKDIILGFRRSGSLPSLAPGASAFPTSKPSNFMVSGWVFDQNAVQEDKCDEDLASQILENHIHCLSRRISRLGHKSVTWN